MCRRKSVGSSWKNVGYKLQKMIELGYYVTITLCAKAHEFIITY